MWTWETLKTIRVFGKKKTKVILEHNVRHKYPTPNPSTLQSEVHSTLNNVQSILDLDVLHSFLDKVHSLLHLEVLHSFLSHPSPVNFIGGHQMCTGSAKYLMLINNNNNISIIYYLCYIILKYVTKNYIILILS